MRDYMTTRKDTVPTYLPHATTLARRYVPSAGRTLAAACEDQGMSFTNRCVCHDMTYYREDAKGMSVNLKCHCAVSQTTQSDCIVFAVSLIARIAVCAVMHLLCSSLLKVIISFKISICRFMACSSPGIFLYCCDPVSRAGSGIPGGIRCGASYHSRSHIPCGIHKA